MMKSIRSQYEENDISTFYKSGEYINPHLERVEYLLNNFKLKNQIINKRVLDLSCGNGEVSKIFMKDNIVEGNDPYTYKFYKEQLNLDCTNYTFNDIAFNNISFNKYDYIICSYALHLCDNSTLPLLLYKLSMITDNLVIVSPSDVILERVNNVMNWKLDSRFKYNRTHLFHFLLKG